MSSHPIYFRSQPHGSNLCGQCCVAMILHCTIDEAKKLVGKGGKTSTHHLRTGLEAKGWTLGPRINAKKVKPELTKVYLARVHWKKGGHVTHWVVINSWGKVVDPVAGFDPAWTREGVAYITSLYEVGPPQGVQTV